MNGLLLDIVILGIVLFLGIGGILSGFIKEAFGLVGILVGVYVSTSNSKEVGEIIKKYIYQSENDLLLNLFGFIVTLVIIWGFFIFLGRVISKLANLSGLGVFDKALGFIFCSGKIFIVFSVIASCISAVPFINAKVENSLSNSSVYPVLVATGKYIANINAVQNTINESKKAIEKSEIIKKGE